MGSMRNSVVRLAIVAVMLCCANPVAAELYENATVGFTVVKPADWQLASPGLHMENLRKTELSSREYKAALLRYATTPLVAFMKHPDSFADINPSFKVTIRPFGDLDASDPKAVLNLLIPQFRDMFHDFEVQEGPVDTEVSAIAAAYARFSYSYETSGGLAFDTTSELWIVPRDDHFFMIGAGTRSDEATGSREEIREIVNSIVIRE